MLPFTIFTLYFYSTQANTLFDQQFQQFLKTLYGEETEKLLTRKDMDWGSSFGGRSRNRSHPTMLNPVILVHGVQDRAGSFREMRDALLDFGYEQDEVYGTTWGAGGNEPIIDVELKCSYVKQIRQLIVAVVTYTGSKADIIGYSMGSPLARKAILGGFCVDTYEFLGPPLTHIVHTYMSVAGANHGSQVCFPAPGGVCSMKRGLFCGSKFIRDINKSSGYEASHKIALYSPKDAWIGTSTLCNKRPYTFKGAETIKVRGRTHDQLCRTDTAIQIKYLTRKYNVKL